MPYPETKQERYSLTGGLNTKVSRYINGPQELIRLVNYDFSVPGSLTKRPDTSSFLGTSFGTNIQTVFEQTYLSGISYRFVFALTGAYFAGASVGIGYYGASTAALGGLTATPIGGIDFNRVSSVNTVDNFWGAGVPVINTSSTFIQAKFLRWNASFGYFVNAQMELASPLSSQFGVSFFGSSAAAFFTNGFGYRWSLAFVNDRGIVGAATPVQMRPTFSGTGATQAVVAIPSTASVPSRFYNNSAYATMLLFRDTIGITASVQAQADVAVTTAIFAIPVSAGNTMILDRGIGFSTSVAAGDTWLLNPLQTVGLLQNSYYRLGVDPRLLPPYQTIPPQPIVGITTGIKNTGEPRYIGMLNNMMVFAGFSMAPSHVFWSQFGVPEWVANEDYVEIRTDDGDVVTGLMPYNNVLIVGKSKSLHEMTGTSPDNTGVQVQTTIYGFMNNFSQCVFNNQLWFLDGQGKGIGQYDGANTQIVSTKVEDIFKRINLDAAKKTSWMLHVKQRNEVWAGIPVDGAITVNCIVVFDYVANSWTTYEGLSPNCVTLAKGSLTLPAAVMGFSNGDIRYMNASYTGSEFVTTIVRFPFVNNFGWSTTQVFRWLFLDVDPVVGVTHTFGANFYLDGGNQVSLTRGITTTAYQMRADFGLPGKGLSIELIEGSTLPCRINGYTVASRFQRQV